MTTIEEKVADIDQRLRHLEIDTGKFLMAFMESVETETGIQKVNRIAMQFRIWQKHHLPCFEWTDERPNQEGYYWMLAGPSAKIVKVRRCVAFNEALCYALCFEDAPAYIAKIADVTNCLWAGPIPLPVEP